MNNFHRILLWENIIQQMWNLKVRVQNIVILHETFSEKAEPRAVKKKHGHRKGSTDWGPQIFKTVEKKYEPFLSIRAAETFSYERENAMDDLREQISSFQNSGTVKNKIRDVVGATYSLWSCRKMRSFKDYGIWYLSQDINMSRVCTRWVPRSDKCKNILETLNVIQIVDAVLTVSCFLVRFWG